MLAGMQHHRYKFARYWHGIKVLAKLINIHKTAALCVYQSRQVKDHNGLHSWTTINFFAISLQWHVSGKWKSENAHKTPNQYEIHLFKSVKETHTLL